MMCVLDYCPSVWWNPWASPILNSQNGHSQRKPSWKILEHKWSLIYKLISYLGIFPGGTSGKESESEVAQSCPTLCDPVDCSLPGSSVHGILQARILEWVACKCRRCYETRAGSLGWEDPLEEGMGSHFSILARRISGTEEPVEWQSIGLQRVGQDWIDLAWRHGKS